MRAIDRRLFLNESALLAATAGILSQSRGLAADEVPARKGAASDKLRVAVIGCRRGGRGMSHIEGFAGKHNCEVTVVCDADKAAEADAVKAAISGKGGQKKAPRFEQDIRKVIADKDIDIISIATPNHWHALMAIWGLQAGKHVYVEKPVSHNVLEGRRIVEFARKTGKICQTGCQNRSHKGIRDSIAFIHDGKIGKVSLAKGLCYKLRGSIGTAGKGTPPKTLDYDLWCGPASAAPMKRTRLHYDWHWTWEYGNGDLGNQGIHEMDKARWGLAKAGFPKSVQGIGGRFGYKDDGETANTQVINFDYGDCVLLFEVRGLQSETPYPGKKSPKNIKKGDKPLGYVGNIWYGETGFVVCPGYNGGVAYSKDGEILAEFNGGGDHFGNFVAAVRANSSKLLNADIEEGHVSSALCHLGNISYRMGGLETMKAGDAPFGNEAADKAFDSMLSHLGSHKVNLGDVKFGKGPKLVLDPKTERFVGSDAGNKMLVREEYRKGFELPDATKG